jgi:hypothetical protein
VNRLRTLRFRYWVMPVILAALAARAFMPAGFMTTTGDGAAAVRISMCSRDKLQRETIVLPDEQAPAQHDLQCKFCGAPILGTPFASFDLVSPVPAPMLAAATETRPAYAPPLRSQTARAPPQA